MIQHLVRRLTARSCPQCKAPLQPEAIDRTAVRFVCPACAFRWYTHVDDDWLS